MVTQPWQQNYVYARGFDTLNRVRNLVLGKACNVLVTPAPSTTPTTKPSTTRRRRTTPSTIPRLSTRPTLIPSINGRDLFVLNTISKIIFRCVISVTSIDRPNNMTKTVYAFNKNSQKLKSKHQLQLAMQYRQDQSHRLETELCQLGQSLCSSCWLV